MITVNKLAAICLLAVAAALLTIVVFGVPAGTVATFGVLLACPLMHVFMMKGHGHGEDHSKK